MTTTPSIPVGRIVHISGPVVEMTGLDHVRLFDIALVGEARLIGEVIHLAQDTVTAQVYENTSGLCIGEPAWSMGHPLVVELGPGLLGQVFDGLQRPLVQLGASSGAYLQRGLTSVSLSQERLWPFEPRAKHGEAVQGGQILGVTPETGAIEHRILVPPTTYGTVVEIHEGQFTINEPVAVIESGGVLHPITLVQQWPVRVPRPFRAKLASTVPVITGTRVIDAFFPIAKGGSAIIPGGFGTGKTVIQQSLACWSDVDVVVYVGCGERGNEMTEVLNEFPQLKDPRTGASLMGRTILIANTSDMPVAAREASIYTGITLAEYYRDMGYHVLLLADSTSRWGEALREISGRMEEIPGEEGYPAYLGSRLSEFYERSGLVRCIGADDETATRTGSVTLVGAVSPPGGDFSEPITQNSMRVTGTYWGLDYGLSRARHFPAISWASSFSLYHLGAWFEEQVGHDWQMLTGQAMALLQRETEIQAIVQLVGPDALSDQDRLILFIAQLLREDFLQQSALDPIDQYSPIAKTYTMLQAIMTFYTSAKQSLTMGRALDAITTLQVVQDIARMKAYPYTTAVDAIRELITRIEGEFHAEEQVQV